MSEFHSPEILSGVLDTLQSGVCVVDREGKIVFWNEGAARATGYMQQEVLGRSCQDFFNSQPPEDSRPHFAACPFSRILHQGKPGMVGMYLRHKRGNCMPALMYLAPVRNQHGSILAVAASFDLHSSRFRRKHSDRNLLPAAGLDVGTGVANHDFTLFQLRENLAIFARYHVPFGILRVRGEGMEHFRATYGREAANAISLVIAQTLSNRFRNDDLVGRWADDEFLVILTNCGSAGVRTVYERTAKVLTSAEIRWWGELLSLPTSIGCCSVETGDSVESVLKRADCPPTHPLALAAVARSSQPGS
jgi:diguanylate cyclase (GGDEF)-like protein/PAS domain S-box-containing protein